MSVEAITFKEEVKKTPEQLQAIRDTIAGFVPAENLIDWHIGTPMEPPYHGCREEDEKLVVVNELADQRASISLRAAWGTSDPSWMSKFKQDALPSESQVRGMMVAILGQAKCPSDVVTAKVLAKTFEYLLNAGWVISHSTMGMDANTASMDLTLGDGEHDVVMALHFSTVREGTGRLDVPFPHYTTSGFWNVGYTNGPSAKLMAQLDGKWQELVMFNGWLGGHDDTYNVQPMIEDVASLMVPMLAEKSVMKEGLLRQLLDGFRANIPGLEFIYISNNVLQSGSKATINGRSLIGDAKRQYSIHFKTGV